ncbi:permease prefix domain 1-containing protein [Amycolatopsis rhabdoformis]|uniref:Permease prefix domain 1-containing protein n=1 Tax=Amycolatopsis rhabdoformis TaxID=1448059 RepID=A0ABZ1HXS5_9PSEU|nr:permease prefix domain 1-containing protein [Amycolatopsis rhabdoformis]WSE26941.1 permease prefix domain 1-containing protein [Amycolatopsis rhabdoformis]
MSTTLTDRYVAATVRHVSGKHRQEIDRELRAAIADDVEGRVSLGESPGRAEYAALAELGDPARLATRYADKASVLIGPATFPQYARALRLLSATVLPIAYIVNGIGHWVRGENAAAAVFSPLGVTVTVAVYLFAAVTVLYVLVDRFGGDHETGEPDEDWKPDQLPLSDATATTTGAELGSGIVLAVVLVVALFGQRSAWLVTTASGARVPVLDPALWGFWVPFFLAVVVLSLALAVANLRLGRWTPATAVAGTVLVLAATGPLAYLFLAARVLNPALGTVFTTTGSWIGWLALVVLVAVSVAVLVKTWGHRDRSRIEAL